MQDEFIERPWLPEENQAHQLEKRRQANLARQISNSNRMTQSEKEKQIPIAAAQLVHTKRCQEQAKRFITYTLEHDRELNK